ncbi:hypothetical protein SLEP1_g51498 [Rubroshorea leprosula]|uniref:Malectin domain-containing protein n=1 Tax=Rubroshorea leprosula TaxID=152421 RepID=A0AAV5M5Y9_9ROSI|nr:hypothetical protein SLEP1_g51498 [Rubroshorea leprosula]
MLADANFAIKCGGPEIIVDGITYEAETSYLGITSSYVIPTEKWAVSNVGSFTDRNNQPYMQNKLERVRNTNSTELYQTSRISTGSLRYYGLGLANGPYTVNLHFAETVFNDPSSHTLESLGRRVFDIYIQGTIVLKDFDISKEAGGVDRAMTKNFIATVTENHLEIHLFWAGNGTHCMLTSSLEGNYGPSISAINVVSNFTPKKNRTGLIIGVAVPVGVVTFTLILIFVVFYLRRRNDDDEKGKSPKNFENDKSGTPMHASKTDDATTHVKGYSYACWGYREHSDNKNKNDLNQRIKLVSSPLNNTEFSDIIAEGR